MLAQLAHERRTKPPNLIITLPLRIKIRTTLSTTHIQPRQRILEDLLESQKLQHAQIHTRVKPQAALVGAQGTVVLHAVPAVDLHGAGVVFPQDAELDDALGDGDDFERFAVLGMGAEEGAVLKR
jgi:hypothetical protein